MRMVSEQCTVWVEQSQVAKFIADRIADGWQVQATRDGPPQPKDSKKEREVELQLSKQHDVNAPQVGNGK